MTKREFFDIHGKPLPPPACNACDKPEPEDNEGWMEAPSGNIYCPECFELLFVKGFMPKVFDPKEPS